MTAATKGFLFQNWAKTYSCRPESYFVPDDEDELKSILEGARDQGKTVRLVGLGRSPSDIACSDEVMVSMRKFNKLIDVDVENCTFTAEAGISIEELNKILKDNGLSFSLLPAISDITLGGVLSTGVHGTGKQFGIMPTYVLEIDLMTAAGETITCSRLQNREIFLAACCSLGALGVILRVKIKCEPMFNLEKITYPSTLDDVLPTLETNLNASEHFDFVWFPFTEGGTIVQHRRRTLTGFDSTKTHGWLKSMFFGYYVLEYLFYLCWWWPSFTKIINRVYYWLYSNNTRYVDWSPNVFNINCLFKQFVTEYSIPREKTAVFLRELQECTLKKNHPAHFPIEVRFVKEDDIYLSPAYGRDSTYINIISYRPFGKNLPHADYWADYEAIAKKYGGRPHWAKAHSMTSQELKEAYPAWEDFNRVRKQLDPKGVFTNRYTRQIFGDSE